MPIQQAKEDNMLKRICILIIMLFIVKCFLYSHDMIILRDGNVINAIVTEISPTEIRYRRADNPTGPLFIIQTARVLSIRFENGTVETINPVTTSNQPRANQPTARPGREVPFRFSSEGFDPNRLAFSLTGGLTLQGIEITRGNYNSMLYYSHVGPEVREGAIVYGLNFNYTTNRHNGGYHVGGFLEGGSYSFPRHELHYDFYLGFGLNAGYKYVTPIGLYFRAGGHLGMGLGRDVYFLFRPDLGVGWKF